MVIVHLVSRIPLGGKLRFCSQVQGSLERNGFRSNGISKGWSQME